MPKNTAPAPTVRDMYKWFDGTLPSQLRVRVMITRGDREHRLEVRASLVLLLAGGRSFDVRSYWEAIPADKQDVLQGAMLRTLVRLSMWMDERSAEDLVRFATWEAGAALIKASSGADDA